MNSDRTESLVESSSSRSESKDSSQPPADEQRHTVQRQNPLVPGSTTSQQASVSRVSKTSNWITVTWALILEKVNVPTSKWQQCCSTINITAAIVTIAVLPLAVMGTWATWAALQLAKWTKQKDERQWCEDVSLFETLFCLLKLTPYQHDWKYPGCDAIKDKWLPLPRGVSTATDERGQEFVTILEPFLPARLWLESLSNGQLRLLCIIGLSVSCLQVAFLWSRRRLIVQATHGYSNRPAKELRTERRTDLPVKRDYKAEDAPEMAESKVPNTTEETRVPYSSENTATSRRRWTLQGLRNRRRRRRSTTSPSDAFGAGSFL